VVGGGHASRGVAWRGVASRRVASRGVACVRAVHVCVHSCAMGEGGGGHAPHCASLHFVARRWPGTWRSRPSSSSSSSR
jgi:hypothetical protein